MNEKEMITQINAHAEAADRARTAAAERRAKRRRWKAVTAEAGMFLLILLLIALESAGLLSGSVAITAIVITLCAMSFLFGYAIGTLVRGV